MTQANVILTEPAELARMDRVVFFCAWATGLFVWSPHGGRNKVAGRWHRAQCIPPVQRRFWSAAGCHQVGAMDPAAKRFRRGSEIVILLHFSSPVDRRSASLRLLVILPARWCQPLSPSKPMPSWSTRISQPIRGVQKQFIICSGRVEIFYAINPHRDVGRIFGLWAVS